MAVGEHVAARYAALTGAADGAMLAGPRFHQMKSVLEDWQDGVFARDVFGESQGIWSLYVTTGRPRHRRGFRLTSPGGRYRRQADVAL